MKAIDEDMTILLGLHAHPGWLIDKCAACQAAKRIMERFRELGAELAVKDDLADRLEKETWISNWYAHEDNGHWEPAPAIQREAANAIRSLKARAEKAEPDATEGWRQAELADKANLALKARVAELEDEKWCHTHAEMETKEMRYRRHPKLMGPHRVSEAREREAKR